MKKKISMIIGSSGLKTEKDEHIKTKSEKHSNCHLIAHPHYKNMTRVLQLERGYDF